MICDCIFPTIKMLICYWLYSQEYRGALLLEQLGSGIMDLVYTSAAPVAKYIFTIKLEYLKWLEFQIEVEKM